MALVMQSQIPYYEFHYLFPVVQGRRKPGELGGGRGHSHKEPPWLFTTHVSTKGLRSKRRSSAHSGRLKSRLQ
jgi:hypothetical protein